MVSGPVGLSAMGLSVDEVPGLQRFQNQAVRFVDRCGVERGEVYPGGGFRIMTHCLADCRYGYILAFCNTCPSVAGHICGQRDDQSDLFAARRCLYF